MVVLVSALPPGGDEPCTLEDREMLRDGLAGRIQSVLHRQPSANLEERLTVPLGHFVENGSPCRVIERLVELGSHGSMIGKCPLAYQARLPRCSRLSRSRLKLA